MRTDPLKADQLLRTLERAARHHGPASLSSSLSAEDMVITDAILRHGLDIGIFAIDTGRLHADTLDMIEAIERKYDYAISVYRPDRAAVEAYATRHGNDAFYDSAELRRQCCHLRKVEPLERALEGRRGWITGLREVAGAREQVPLMQFDETHGVVKINPLAQWNADDVWAYLREHDVPYNRLYDQGYRSIGCAPCTRPTLRHEDERAGRWWWETGVVRECGLHVDAGGRVIRIKEVA